MTQAQLAALIGTEGSVISLLESGERGLSAKWLRRIAPALDTTPGLLLDCSPDQVGQSEIERRRRLSDAGESKGAMSHSTDLSAGRRSEAHTSSEEKIVKLETPRRKDDESSTDNRNEME